MKPFNLSEWLANPSRKIVTRDGRPVRIVCWDAPTKNPIYGFVEGDDGITSWRKDGRFSNLIDNIDLFFADKEEKMNEFETRIYNLINFSDPYNYPSIEEVKEEAEILLDLARKEILEEFRCREELFYKNGFEKGREDALKNLPKWKKSFEHKDIEMHIAILEDNKVLLSNYLEEGDYYIVLDDLKTLPKE